MRRFSSVLIVPLMALLVFALVGCGDDTESVTLYTSVDEPNARPIVERFEEETGIRVRLVTDTEANKSVGLSERLRAEANRPVADVFWNNEPFRTVQLATEGLFAQHDWSTASDVLPQYRDPEGRWVGTGLRARVLAVPSDFADESLSIEALASPRFEGRVVMPRPTAGSTAGHVAALYELWGQERADAFFRAIHDNGIYLSAGNGPSAKAVAQGQASLGLTDNNDVANVNANLSSEPVRAILPDQGEGEMGTLTTPPTVALVARPGSQPSEAAKRLADFLASAEVEAMLIEDDYTIGSVRDAPDQGGIRAMDVDYADVAKLMSEAPQRALELLEGRAP